jgi:hypothetical protein
VGFEPTTPGLLGSPATAIANKTKAEAPTQRSFRLPQARIESEADIQAEAISRFLCSRQLAFVQVAEQFLCSHL